MWRLIFLIHKGWRYLSANGFLKTAKRVFMVAKLHRKIYNLPKEWVASEKTLQKQRETVFPYAPVISIIVPLFNTPLQYLREMLDSVCVQSYANWQLCLADGSDCVNHLEEIVRSYAMQYPGKIKYIRLKENRGISENTNACIALADGDYLALLDHDDVLAPDALFEAVKVIAEQHADFIYTDEITFTNKLDHIISVHFKANFAIDNLRANNYICHFTLFKKSLLEKAGLFRKEYDGSQDHDMILRLTEVAEHIVHVPKILYYWRAHGNSVATDISSKTYAVEAGKRAVSDHLRRLDLKAKIESLKAFPSIYRIKYELKENPLISIIIPSKESLNVLQRCVNSILKKSTYSDYEIIIVDNNSSADAAVLSYYQEIEMHINIQVFQWNHPFNYSAVNNFGAQYAKGKYLVLLNSNTEVIAPNWMEEMLMYAQRLDVGAVGAKLYFENDKIQHAGIIIGLDKDRLVGHAHYKFSRNDIGYMGRLYYAQNMSAVTAACMMVKKSLYNELGGFDESFAVAYNDVDFCLRLRNAGYLVVFTPYAEFYYYGLKSRGVEDTPDKKARFQKQIRMFKERWEKELMAGDPYYNPNLSLDRGDFLITQLSVRPSLGCEV